MFNLPLTLLRKIGLIVLMLLFLIAGLNHFNHPDFYVSIMPPYLPFQYELSNIAGFFEILGALGLLFAKTRRIAGYGLILLLIAIFPVNIHMALHPDNFKEHSALLIYLRIPLHIIFISWVYWAAVRKKAVGYHF